MDEDEYDDEYDDDEARREPRSMRWLVGGLLAAVLVVGLVFAVTNLGSLFKSSPKTTAVSSPSASAPAQTGQPCDLDRQQGPGGQFRPPSKA